MGELSFISVKLNCCFSVDNTCIAYLKNASSFFLLKFHDVAYILQMLHSCWVYYISKFTEFFDTVSLLYKDLSIQMKIMKPGFFFHFCTNWKGVKTIMTSNLLCLPKIVNSKMESHKISML